MYLQGSETRPPERARRSKFQHILIKLKPRSKQTSISPGGSSAPDVGTPAEPGPSKARQLCTKIRNSARKPKPAVILALRPVSVASVVFPPLQGAVGVVVDIVDFQTVGYHIPSVPAGSYLINSPI